MFVAVSPSWASVRRFETLTRCADVLEEICDDVHLPEAARRNKVPVVGRLLATLDEVGDKATSLDFRSARESLRLWSERGSVADLRGLFAAAANALRLEARALIGRRPDQERRVALLYQLAMIAETSPGRALAEYRIRDDFAVDHLVAERWVNAAKERGHIEVLEFHPESGRSLKITQSGLEVLESTIAGEDGSAVSSRDKQQKFGILDGPHLLASDVEGAVGALGTCTIYLDLDDFKQLNTRFTERVVDRTILPELHRMIDSFGRGNGYSYAEGGDEVIILLTNATEAMGEAFAGAVLARIREAAFRVGEDIVRLTASAGLASSERFALNEIADAANQAKAEAKRRGKDRVVVAGRT